MPRLNRSSSASVKSADKVAVLHYANNREGFQYGIAAYDLSLNEVTICSDGSGLIMYYPSRAKAIDSIRRLNSSFNASNVHFVEYNKIGFIGLKSFFKSAS
jgi:hypothetical protein